MSRTFTRRLLITLIAGVSLSAWLLGCSLFPNSPPVAEFQVRYFVDEEDPMVVALDATESSDPDGDAITSYMWTFGDDAVVTPKVYTGTYEVPVLWVRYPDEGEYAPQLVVVDERGKPSEATSRPVLLPPPGTP